MTRSIALACLGLWFALSGAVAQELQGTARVDPAKSQITDLWGGGAAIEIHLSQGVPFRIYPLADPARIVVDFREALWDGVTSQSLLNADSVLDVRFGRIQEGWSRLVLQLAQPMLVDLADLRIDESSGQAVLDVQLRTASIEEFSKNLGTASVVPDISPLEIPAKPDRLHVVLDPGHGGIDPGALAGEMKEADLMLSVARGLRDALRARGIEVSLTREADVFVPLQTRIALAHNAGADVFVSLHADTLAFGQAQGATVYTLSDEASDTASSELAERLDRDELLAGVDLQGTDDAVAQVLMELARIETGPRGQALARAVVDGLQSGLGRINSRPLRQAGFSVLRAPDIPSILIELGFLSNDRDLNDLGDPEWRASAAEAIADGIQIWASEDSVLRTMMRQ
jgi:N-acetylmuramoyl-L-alanine amidase